ncbi:hypothetical protein LguiB_016585 [Lonicera macranthoides]
MVEKEVEGLGMYTDMSCLTIVYQDEVGGLQVRSREMDGYKSMSYIPAKIEQKLYLEAKLFILHVQVCEREVRRFEKLRSNESDK